MHLQKGIPHRHHGQGIIRLPIHALRDGTRHREVTISKEAECNIAINCMRCEECLHIAIDVLLLDARYVNDAAEDGLGRIAYVELYVHLLSNTATDTFKTKINDQQCNQVILCNQEGEAKDVFFRGKALA